MQKKIVIDILQDSNAAQTALDNLSEADFDAKDISVVMQNEQTARALADDTGPLKGDTAADLPEKLKTLGLNKQQGKGYQDALSEGKVLIAIQTDPDTLQAAQDMLKDYTNQIQVVSL